MTATIEIDEQVKQRLDEHREDDEDYDRLLEDLLDIYEQEGTFTRQGYSE